MLYRKFLSNFSTQAFRVNQIKQSKRLNSNKTLINLVKKNKQILKSDDTPSERSPSFLKDQLIQDSQTAQLQYTFTAGIPSLLEIAAKFYEPKIGKNLNIMSDILITPGHNSALTCILLAFCNFNEEVVSFSPCQDSYRESINFNGARIVDVQLKPKPSQSKEQIQRRFPDYTYKAQDDEWELDFKTLYEKINERTKILLINQPHNPTGKIFTEPEFKEISHILKMKNSKAIILLDELNAEVCFEPNQPFQFFRPFQIEDLKDRTLLLADIGSIFSSPGMGVSVTIGNPNLINAIKSINQISYFCLNEVFQKSLSNALNPIVYQDYFLNKKQLYNEQKNALLNVLSQSNLNLRYWIPNGGIHILTSVDKSSVPSSYLHDNGQSYKINQLFVKWLEEEKNILAYPISSDPELVRWSFTKSLEEIKKTGINLL